MHLNSELLFRKYARPLFKSHIKVLEVGPDRCNPGVFRSLVENDSVSWETLDMEHSWPGLTYVSLNEYSFPLPDNSFDIVFSSSVIEHVRKVWVWVKELARICKTGGHVITINPVSWPHHAVPVDCWRIYPQGMKALYEEAGLAVQLSLFETLEKAPSRRSLPGRTHEPDRGPLSGIKSLVKTFLGWPLTHAVDTITIGQKLS